MIFQQFKRTCAFCIIKACELDRLYDNIYLSNFIIKYFAPFITFLLKELNDMKLSKKFISITLTAVLILGLCLGLASINPVSHAAGNCIVKVKLDSLGKVTSVNIKVNSSYSLPTGTYLDQGSYTVYLDNGKVALKNSSGSIIYTSDSGYIRLTKRDSKDSGIKIGSYEYLGDFVFAKNGSYINVINHVDMETYLIGVVPYEIGENFNIEALKAQAVSARSYSYDRLNGSTSATSYDIGDTSKDQVYRGYNSANKNCIKAVMETAGQVLTYNGNVISTLYSASNGGMTSSNYYRWGSSPLPYFKVKLDEFDKAASFDSSSYNTKFYIPKAGASVSLDSYVQKTLMPELLIQLYEKGYSTDPKNFEIIGFDNLSLHTARFNDEYCIMYLYLKADVSLNAYKGTQGISPAPPEGAKEYMQITGTGYSGRCSLYEGPSSQYGVLASPREGSYVQILSKSGDYYEILAANGDTGYVNKKYLTNSRFTQQTDILMIEDTANQPQDTASPTPTSGPSAESTSSASVEASDSSFPQASPSPQAELIPAPQEKITITLNIPMEGLKYTATCEDGYTFSFMNNKLVPYVQEQSDRWLLTLNGNGHGIGLSQIGARARAQAGQSYDEILAFYFDDTKLKTLDYEVLGPNSVPELDPAKWYGVVSLKDPSSSLNVRSAANTNSSKLGQLRNGTYIELLEKLSSGWYKVMFNGSIGYVSSDYIIEGERPSPTAPDVSAAPTNPTGPEIWTGTVSLIDPNSSLYVRATPDSNGDVVASISHGTEVELISENNGWFYISYTHSHDELIKGYVNASYIIAGEKPAGGADQTSPAPTSSSGPSSSPSDNRPELYIGTVTGTSDLPVRAQANETSDILASVKSGASLTVLDDSGETWCYVQTAQNIKGYCSKNYLVINKLSAFDPPQGSSVIGTVKDMDLNVRSQPSSSSLLLATISLGTKVNVIAQASNDWYYIQLPDGSYGYVSYRYLDVETVQNTPTVPPTSSNTAAPSASQTPSATTTPSPTIQASVTATPSARPSVSATPSTQPSVSVTASAQPSAPTATPSSSGSAPSPAPETGKVKLKDASSRLNVRSGPGTSYAITGRINNGASVTILARSGGWYQIQSGSIKGYVSTDYIVLDGQAPVQRQGIVTGADSLRVRTGPGTSYARLASIKRNTAVTILDEVSGWYKIRLANGTEGYCSAEYITVSSAPDPVHPSDSEKIGTVTGIDVLNVRSGPSVSNGLLFTISRGTQVKVLETTANGWHKIQVMNKIGYVSGTYLEVKTVSVTPTPTVSPSAPSSPTSAATTAPVTQAPSSAPASTTAPSPSSTSAATSSATVPPVNQTGKIKLENSSSRLNVRSGPGTTYAISGKLNNGASVTVLSQKGEWYQIQSGSVKGYVLAKYVVVGQDQPAPSERQGTVTGTDSLRVRKGPGTSYDKLTSISRGTKITVLDETSGWYKIRLANGTEGYCSSEYITVSNEGDSDKPQELGTGIVNNISSLNVRSGPSTNYGIVSSISGGTKVTLISRHSNGWYYISTPSGIKGYVSGNYIKADSDSPSDTPSQTRQGTVKLSSSSSRLNIRSSASTSSDIIGKAPHGAKVTVLSQSGDWYKIQYNGITGFVSKSYIVI